MTDRLFLYPVLLVTGVALVFLLRDASRWLLVPILRHGIVLAVASGAFLTGDVGLAWGVFGVLIVGPRLAYRWAVRCLQRGQVARATWWRQVARLGVPDPREEPELPALVRGELLLWQLWSLTGPGQWARAVEFYESVESWGVLSAALGARLAVARAYAETGQVERAVRQLTVVALAPRTMGTFDREFVRTREQIVALAGESPELALLRHAEAQTVEWRQLLSWGRPGWVTAGLVAVLTAIMAGNAAAGMMLYVDFGNLPWAEMGGEWYRPVTALGVHGGWEHLALNAAGLWLFGAALERARGWWWMVAVFFVTGAAANFASAAVGDFDVSIGASGGVFGLVGAFGVALYRWRGPLQAGLRRLMLGWLGLMVAVDFVIGALEPQIDQVAHVSGLVTGILLAMLFPPRTGAPAAK